MNIEIHEASEANKNSEANGTNETTIRHKQSHSQSEAHGSTRQTNGIHETNATPQTRTFAGHAKTHEFILGNGTMSSMLDTTSVAKWVFLEAKQLVWKANCKAK